MLNFIEISNRINHPELIQLDDLEGLRQLAERYPFTALFSQLYLKGLAMHNTIQFEAELKNHAYRIPDRTQLFQMVHFVDEVQGQAKNVESNTELDSSLRPDQEIEQPSDSIEAVQEEFDQEISTPAADQVLQENTELPKVASVTDEKLESPLADSPEEKSKEEIAVVSSHKFDRNEEEGKTQEESEKQEEGGGTKNIKRVGDLERDILAHAISSSIYLEVDKASEEIYSFARLKQLDKPKEFENDSAAIEFDLPKLKFAEEDQPEKEVQEETEEKRFKTFTSWMSTFVEDKNQDSTSKKQLEIPQKEEGNPKIEKEKEKNKEISVVEKRKNEFFSPLQKARESLDETRLPVSETLAKVYAAQGNYPKAIVAYEKLSLKFPEKKSFFALQIETLKRKLN